MVEKRAVLSSQTEQDCNDVEHQSAGKKYERKPPKKIPKLKRRMISIRTPSDGAFSSNRLHAPMISSTLGLMPILVSTKGLIDRRGDVMAGSEEIRQDMTRKTGTVDKEA